MSNSEHPETLHLIPEDRDAPGDGAHGHGSSIDSGAGPDRGSDGLDRTGQDSPDRLGGKLSVDGATSQEPKGSSKRNKSSNPERRFSGRCSPERLSGETSRQERRELADALAHSLRSKISDGKSVYLDGLGVLFPEQHELPRAYLLGNQSKVKQLAVRRETITKLNFERAGELSPFIRDRYHSPLELSDLLCDVYRHLPLPLQVGWTHAQMRFYLGGLVALLRREIVLDGFSHRLAPFCSFFALHNRQGDSTVDWFAGADIFVHSDFEHVRRVEQPKLMERARFASLLEFGEVALGAKRHIFPLNISQALNDIGISASRSFYPDIEVIVLERAPGRLAFLTNGARNIPLLSGEMLGAEFVLDCELAQLAAWPFTLIAALIEEIVSEQVQPSGGATHGIAGHQAGILSRPSGIGCVSIPPQAFGIASTSSDGTNSHEPEITAAVASTTWAGALVSSCNANEAILLEDDSSVRVLWITPLQQMERIIAERRTPEHTAALLIRKGVMLVARLNRASVLFRTEIL